MVCMKVKAQWTLVIDFSSWFKYLEVLRTKFCYISTVQLISTRISTQYDK